MKWDVPAYLTVNDGLQVKRTVKKSCLNKLLKKSKSWLFFFFDLSLKVFFFFFWSELIIKSLPLRIQLKVLVEVCYDQLNQSLLEYFERVGGGSLECQMGQPKSK